MPWGDVQFWIVTIFFLGAIALLVRQFRPGRRKAARNGGAKGRPRRANLTIEGHRAASGRTRDDHESRAGG